MARCENRTRHDWPTVGSQPILTRRMFVLTTLAAGRALGRQSAGDGGLSTVSKTLGARVSTVRRMRKTMHQTPVVAFWPSK
jgi:hypothetical protein